VLMSIEPGDEIGSEVHSDRDQFFRVESGQGEVWIDGVKSKIEESYAVVVPAKAKHNIVNTGSEPLRLYTIYGPPEHQYRTVQETRAMAQASHEHFDGKTSEQTM
jgi:mannose-6-phosphate isomerase-like protein (cupin superfamily)